MDISVWIDRHAGFAPGKTAICFGGREITYEQLAARIGVLAGLLVDLKAGPGTRVAYLGLNHPGTIALLFACARTGAIFLPLNWRLEAPEHIEILNDCTPVVLFADADYLAHGRSICTQTGIRVVAMNGADGTAETVEGLSKLTSPVYAMRPDARGSDPVLLCYTSGATGRPKGVVLDQNALFVNAVNSAHMHAMTSDDVALVTLPLFHAGGLNILSLPVLHAGGTLVLHSAFDLDNTFAALEHGAITLTVLVPAQLSVMINDARWAQVDFPALRMITTGSTPVATALIRAVHEKPAALIQVYGSTETAPLATYLRAEDARAHEGSAGKVALHCQMRIIDDNGDDVKDGQSGEIAIRGANVMQGYWNAPEATGQVLVDGWFHTGDIGHLDKDGYLYVDDRKKDMIISGGENVYPAELENILAECAHIVEAAVVGRPDDKWGEQVVAFVVATDDNVISEAQVKALFAGRLARYKHPRQVVFCASLPRNVMGKVKKDELRHMLAGKATGPG